MRHIRLQIIHFIAVCSFLFLVFSINSCKNPGSENSKPVISVSILPQKYFVQKIARDNFDINVLIPPGASPASYDPTPGQLTQLADSKIYFKIGHIEFEKNWINMFAKEYPDLKIIDTSVGLELLNNESSHGHHIMVGLNHIFGCHLEM